MSRNAFNMSWPIFVGKWLVAEKLILQINVIKNGILLKKEYP